MQLLEWITTKLCSAHVAEEATNTTMKRTSKVNAWLLLKESPNRESNFFVEMADLLKKEMADFNKEILDEMQKLTIFPFHDEKK